MDRNSSDHTTLLQSSMPKLALSLAQRNRLFFYSGVNFGLNTGVLCLILEQRLLTSVTLSFFGILDPAFVLAVSVVSQRFYCVEYCNSRNVHMVCDFSWSMLGL
ncbi:hypothetical protein PHYBLDRAFT_61366 [Phycomyces blakesleeanus NRRL 1555(-)]|uniref:Uncharacterized protein n=1 Tax=Phycomyces blakesleeanus (strain ATCC 8743b / DSM 1359 / FGSC 10004 / NBRC 33097 / NRRL 1555) TaxID=763407 RepID=A0A167QUZ4_PHYB8|nr:hypothetical protein PHYBLDRAFT_61366 [Phycomyces blakesleeanus NRRL 1555(-)]OAD80318.1 hypothetical protein PHYBLDRAFT_61366 [Phycomyces blakesleeanus NRRL 1555(-)]|eukprot:XP_018298358.1 hypothetical protein PHYBLDRAFT_61366 [Phycomyces blakesleeanus NRRL 1555(-)]